MRHMSYRLAWHSVRYTLCAGAVEVEAVADGEETRSHAATSQASAEGLLVDALRGGDERVFASLIDKHTSAMLRLALLYVPTRAVAEEVVQETWLAVMRGVASFEGRSSLRTWIFRILLNKAKSSGLAERRNLPLDDLDGGGEAEGPPVVDPARFTGLPRGYWSSPPSHWDELPEERLLARETLALVERAMASLPRSQRAVFELRDLQHWTAAEVCEALGITAANQRVLLHRARARMRTSVEEYLDAR